MMILPFPSERQRQWRIRKGLLPLLVVVIVEAGLQLAASAVIVEPRTVRVYDPEVGWVYSGHATLYSPQYGNYELRFNSLGLRGPEVTAPVALMFLGDSVTSGSDTPEPYTFAAQLGAVNAGTSGYGVAQSARRYRRDWHSLRPATLVFVLTPQEFYVPPSLTVWDIPWYGFLKLKESEGGVRLYRWFSGTVYPDRNAGFARTVYTPPPAGQWERWWSYVQQVHAVRAGMETKIVYMPSAAQVMAYQAGERDFWINERIERGCAAEGLDYMDLTPVLAQYDTGDIYVDHLHLSVAGHTLVADTLRKMLHSGNARTDDYAMP